MKTKEKIEIHRISKVPDKLFGEYQRDVSYANEQYLNAIKMDPVKIGVFANGKLIGFAIGEEFGLNEFHVNALFVKKEFRGKGIGARMMFRMKGEAKKQGLSIMTLCDVNAASARAAKRAKQILKAKNIHSIRVSTWLQHLPESGTINNISFKTRKIKK
ncbi:MAG: GNAT family N-acetyltransferase [archaeon]